MIDASCELVAIIDVLSRRRVDGLEKEREKGFEINKLDHFDSE